MGRIVSIGVCLLTLLFPPIVLADSLSWDKWRPVDAEALALKQSKVEKDADAEALFWEVRVQDEWDGYSLNNILLHYIRIKVFNERGRESQSKRDIPYDKNERISEIAGRTIKTDGEIIELKKDGIFDRTIVKASGLKLRAKSFVMPNVQPGDVIEYRWRETRTHQSANYMRLHFQRDIPIQLVKYYVKPLSSELIPYEMRSMTFHGQSTPFQREINGFYSTTMVDLPAFREEPYMPPEDEVRAWMLIYYSEDKKLVPEKYWKEHGKEIYKKTRGRLKVNSDIQQKAAALTANASTPENKLQHLFDFCRTQIKNIHDDATEMTSQEREKLKENKSAADTLKSGKGDSLDINGLFAALAIAAGFDARIAAVPDRGDTFFNPNFVDSYFLQALDVAVKLGDEWHFFDPSSRFVPFGMLRWEEEGVQALITDPKEPVFVKTPLSAPEKSRRNRTAKLRLSEDGTLEGDVTVEASGHLAARSKEANDTKSINQREEDLSESVRNRLSTAEVTNITLSNAEDPLAPDTASYHIKVPGYATRTGKRLFLQPAFFQFSLPAYFLTDARKYDVYFHYPWSERDSVRIELPDGFVLDNADQPQSIPGVQGAYKIKILITKDQKVLIYEREFFFGGNETIYYPVGTYSRVRRFFDGVHEGDNHVITLKQSS